MNHIGLFEGIGGFSLAARWMGWETIAWCEINPFCQKVLTHHFPKAKKHEDIKTTDFRIYRGKCDILTAGFPCQPFSVAGKRLGKEDDRHLWPHCIRAIREIQPRYVVGENVGGIISWSRGLVFEEVQTDLETAGYEVWAYVLPACGVDAPHRRDRVWFVAHSHNQRNATGLGQVQRENEEIPQRHDNAEFSNTGSGDVSYSKQHGLERGIRSQGAEGFEPGREGITTNTNSGRFTGKEHRQTESGRFAEASLPGDWQNFPTQPPIRWRNDGIPTRLDGITFPKWRNESIKAFGNAIVPQVAFEIFKAIQSTQCQ